MYASGVRETNYHITVSRIYSLIFMIILDCNLSYAILV